MQRACREAQIPWKLDVANTSPVTLRLTLRCRFQQVLAGARVQPFHQPFHPSRTLFARLLLG